MSRTRQFKGAIPILLDLKSCVWQLKSQTVLTVTLVLVLLAALLSGVAPAFADNGNTQTQAPVITSAGPFTVDEGETAVGTLTANDGDSAAADLVWSIPTGSDGGADADKFTLSASGELAFNAAKDFEAPDDNDADGTYEVTR